MLGAQAHFATEKGFRIFATLTRCATRTDKGRPEGHRADATSFDMG